MTSRAECIHEAFRGATEFVKRMRLLALGLDFVAAALSVAAILGDPQRRSGWYPVWVLTLAVGSTAVRAYSFRADSFAQRCRKISIRAYALGQDVDSVTEATIDDDTPPCVGMCTKGLPATSLEEYYEPSNPPGQDRLRELYAHSAFYTWRLLRLYAFILAILGIVVFIGAGLFVYLLAMDNSTAVTYRHAALEVICTVVLLVLSIRALETGWKAADSSRSIRTVENDLLKKPKGQALLDLVDSYDLDRASGPNPPTLLYLLRRKTLQRKWHRRREALIGLAAQPSTAST